MPAARSGPSTYRSYWPLLPLAGMCIFLALYIKAAAEYPGGSYANPDSTGFSFWHNYLCDLLDNVAINGEPNTARLYARMALGVLCISLLYLWGILPGLFTRKSGNLFIMWFTGILALGTLFFLGTESHDGTVRLAGVFGVMALLSSFVEFYKEGYKNLIFLGNACLLIFLFNYYIYETGDYIRSLPVIQKLTFALFLIWFTWLNLVLYKKMRLDRA